ncbi:hypothetical protein A1359_06290 [Methylomonas lenta]|uniref:Uncharacterized protein n=1 Tax=Methylomonas lenta TaxID=980561 RepID=A0A177NI63_9GAMM|nr:hypothetical protein A1359_06290 [Methylomonas lenta]
MVPMLCVTAIKLRKNNPFSLREKVRMRGLNKAFLPYYKSPLPNPLQQERELFLNLMALMLCVGTLSRTLQRPEPQSGSSCIPTRSVGTMRLGIGKIFPTISLRLSNTKLKTFKHMIYIAIR